MRFLFYMHSLVSDWNHGNAHFLRGVMHDLINRGHEARALEPAGSWSRTNLIADQGAGAEDDFHRTFPELKTNTYGLDFDHEAAVADADVVVVHEWTDPTIVSQLGQIRSRGGTFTLVFHDTHHRAISAREEIAGLTLGSYDIILAFGEVLRQRYLDAGWGQNVFTWHEAADTNRFHPLPQIAPERDLIWVGNWGDDERTREISEFLIEPAANLQLSGTVRGVRYPGEARERIAHAGLEFGGWIANARVPEAFARHRATVHIPRRPYVEALPGIPTIRMFEALACGIPLVSAPWTDAENLFRPGVDYLVAANGTAMKRHLRTVLYDAALRNDLVAKGIETIRSRHTCTHRVDELLDILATHGSAGVRNAMASVEAAE